MTLVDHSSSVLVLVLALVLVVLFLVLVVVVVLVRVFKSQTSLQACAIHIEQHSRTPATHATHL